MRLIVEDITKKYSKKVALNSASFSVNNGIYGILGPNGAGKTTLIRIIAGLVSPNSGKITFDNKNIIKDINTFRYKLGYLPQEFGCFKHLTVKECLENIAIIKGIINKLERREQIKKLLKEVNLEDNSKKKVGSLSGGMKRRLGIAQALLGNPSLIMVDEPTAGLDPEERIKFRSLIRKISSNRVVLLSTHIIEDIKNNCDGLILIQKGIIEQIGDINLLQNYAKDKIWEKSIYSSEFEEYENKYNILSTNKRNDKIDIRIYSNEKIENSKTTEPTLEEGYLAWIKK
ncbi:MAG: ABC transporter ATP-binding protein [Clostridiales bacterium]